MINEIGIPFEMKLPHVAFHRHIGEFSSIKADVASQVLGDAEWQKRRGEFSAVGLLTVISSKA